MGNGDIRLDSAVLPEDALELANGKSVESVYELIKELKKMDEDTFRLHISKSRHDFRNWFEEAYGNKKVEIQAGKIKGRLKMIRFLEKNVGRSKRNEDPDKFMNLISGSVGKIEALEEIGNLDDDLTRGNVK